MPQLIGKQAGDIGLGLMGMTWRTSPLPEEQAFKALRAAISSGSRLSSTYRWFLEI